MTGVFHERGCFRWVWVSCGRKEREGIVLDFLSEKFFLELKIGRSAVRPRPWPHLSILQWNFLVLPNWSERHPGKDNGKYRQGNEGLFAPVSPVDVLQKQDHRVLVNDE